MNRDFLARINQNLKVNLTLLHITVFIKYFLIFDIYKHLRKN